MTTPSRPISRAWRTRTNGSISLSGECLVVCMCRSNFIRRPLSVGAPVRARRASKGFCLVPRWRFGLVSHSHKPAPPAKASAAPPLTLRSRTAPGLLRCSPPLDSPHTRGGGSRQFYLSGLQDKLVLPFGGRRQLDLLDAPAVVPQGAAERRLAGDVAG